MNVIDAMQRRRATKFFEPEGLNLSREEIENLIEGATLAPSEYNLQPWRFIIVKDKERKEVLYQCACRQEKIRECAAVIIVMGDLQGYETARIVVSDQAEKGLVPKEKVDEITKMIISNYENNEKAQEMLAIRNASLIAMAIMLLAIERGIATCPMGGFDESALRKAFHIPKRYKPILLIALGMPSTSQDRKQPTRGIRIPVKEIVWHEDIPDLEK